MSLKNQAVAQRLAVCNDIGEAAYVASLVAAGMVDSVLQTPTGPAIAEAFMQRCGYASRLHFLFLSMMHGWLFEFPMTQRLADSCRYKLSPIGLSGETYVAKVAEAMFQVRGILLADVSQKHAMLLQLLTSYIRQMESGTILDTYTTRAG
jgi:hypothetical protein